MARDRVYRLAFDASYRFLALADPSLLATDAFHFDSTSRAANWKPVALMSVDDQKPEPDFWKLEGVPAAFICNEYVLNDMPILWAGKVCEPLPVHYNGRPLWLGNVTEYGCYSALDVANCAWASGGPGQGLPTRYAFFPKRLGPMKILTIPETCEYELYVHEYNGDPVYEFKADVERLGMTGLVFEEIWRENELNFENEMIV